MAGGLAGGLIGNMLFGGSGHAASGGGSSAGGIGLIDILIIGVGIYFLMKYLKRRRLQAAEGTSYYGGAESAPYAPQQQQSPYFGGYEQGASPQYEELQRGLQDIARYDPGFNEETFKETAQDLFFRIQAGWMNRSVEGIDNLLTSEMAQFFNGEFAGMKQQGRINRLENIAVRKVEPSEAWQEAGKDYITVLFTANLLDYTVDDKTGQVVGGDKLNPVKFEEFWTFVRDVGTSQWKLSAINQTNQSSGRIN